MLNGRDLAVTVNLIEVAPAGAVPPSAPAREPAMPPGTLDCTGPHA